MHSDTTLVQLTAAELALIQELRHFSGASYADGIITLVRGVLVDPDEIRECPDILSTMELMLHFQFILRPVEALPS